MAEVDFGNEQDISVHDKEHPTLGPTEEAQDVASLERIVVPPGAFLDPENPNTINNSVNVSLNDHPNPLAEDYGKDVVEGQGAVDVEYQPLSATLNDLGSEAANADGVKSAAASSQRSSENRDEWTKADWRAEAQSLGLPVSGSIDTLRERVEEHEAAQEERSQYEREVKGMSREELDKLAGEYDIDPSEYSNKDDLAAAVMAAYDEQ